MLQPASVNAADQAACTNAIQKGSLSFAAASFLLSLKHRSAVHTLYSWCRHCDNTIDDIPQSAPTSEKLAAIEALRRDTDAALSGSYIGNHFVFRSLTAMQALYRIPPRYYHDMIDGMAMDISKHRYKDMEELRLYCYRVAGVVGLMFSTIVGLRDQGARDHAVALGIAMQLTNIARDVAEDFRMGRIYIPMEWVAAAGIGEEHFLQSKEMLFPVVQRLLSVADDYYRLGDRGIKDLPWKAALAAKAARNIYSEIGRRVLSRGPDYFSSRTVISGNRKIVLICKTLAQLAMQIPWRMMHPFRRSNSLQEWRYQ